MPVEQIRAEIVFKIPDDMVLIERTEYERLQSNDDIGRWWDINEVLSRIKRGRVWFTYAVLDNPKYKKKIDVKNGGFVKYPKGGRDSYSFHPARTKEFLENYFVEILKND